MIPSLDETYYNNLLYQNWKEVKTLARDLRWKFTVEEVKKYQTSHADYERCGKAIGKHWFKPAERAPNITLGGSGLGGICDLLNRNDVALQVNGKSLCAAFLLTSPNGGEKSFVHSEQNINNHLS